MKNCLPFLLLGLLVVGCENNVKEDNVKKISFWNETKRGANIFNAQIIREDIKAAKKYGIKFVRISIDKWPTKARDFLLGNADNYTSLVPEDLILLKQNLKIFEEEEMPVVITVLSLPGCRWKQNNNDVDDGRIWTDGKYQKQAANYWKNLATELKEYKIIIGYNVLNEPHPERLEALQKEQSTAIQKRLFDFYNLLVSAIREVDRNTPIILDSSNYADALCFKNLQPLEDKNVIYSFHMYEPFEYTNWKLNPGKCAYPGKINEEHSDRVSLEKYMQSVCEFQKKYNIPSNRIFAGEFGVNRRQKGSVQYLKDLIYIFEKNKWHWAFYAFREDTWHEMDYELGNKRAYFSKEELKMGAKLPERRDSSPHFIILKNALNKY